MSYVALYRLYRPKAFDAVAGQRAIVKTLQNALKNDKMGHAYLFSGPRGTGKTSIAKIIAKTLNCRQAPTSQPCGVCDICQAIDKGEISDIIEIDAASNNGVDEIRDLRDKVKYAPSVGRYKVYIIDEVHMLTTGAFNALLKTLEEPPRYVVFILATTEIHKIPATIISRCQRFDFKNIEPEDMIAKLSEVSKKENINITPEALDAIAQYAEGGMRDALSLLDQVLSYTDDTITEADVFEVSGGLSRELISQIILAAYKKDDKTVLEYLNEALLAGKDVVRMINDLILALRDCLLDKARNTSKYPDLKALTPAYIYAYLNILNELQSDIKWTNQKRAYLEVGLLKMVNHHSVDDVASRDKIQALEDEIIQLKNRMTNYQEPKVVAKEVSNTKGEKPLVTIEDIENILNNGDKDKKALLKRAWPTLKNYDRNHLKMTAQILAQGSLEAVNDHTMLLVYDDLITAQIMYQPETKEKVLQILNHKTEIIRDYKVILKSDWLLIKDDYISQYNTGTTKPKLKPRNLNLYEEKKVIAKNQTVELAYQYFGKEKVKVEE